MEVKTAKITNVRIGATEKTLIAHLVFEGECPCSFFLSDKYDIKLFLKLMDYAFCYDVEDLKGKTFRLVMDNANILFAIGHPTEDKFIIIRRDILVGEDNTDISFQEVKDKLAVR